ncbi:BolA family protein [Alteromonas sp. CYL-A6]|uniref:BolA family protein n=1 Tax=Alteromonas nitratireducens TaxID=3390813 RepID=UPI0034A6F5FB
MNDVKAFIESQLTGELAPVYLLVEDESHMHNVAPGAQSHFKVTVVSAAFEGQRLIARHRQVNGLLSEALAGPVHALALHTFTPDEWQARGGEVSASPACLGGSKFDNKP